MAVCPGEDAFARHLDRIALRMASASALIFAGALPPGVLVDTRVRILRAAAGAGVPAFVDASGDALRHACTERLLHRRIPCSLPPH